MGHSDLAAVEAKYHKVAEAIQHLSQENAHLRRELDSLRSAPKDTGENAALKAEISSLQETVAGLEQLRDNLIEKINTLYMVAGADRETLAEDGPGEMPPAPAPRPVAKSPAAAPKAAEEPQPDEGIPARGEAKAIHPLPSSVATNQTQNRAPEGTPVAPAPKAPEIAKPAKAEVPAQAPAAKAPEARPTEPAPKKSEKDENWVEDDPFDDEGQFEDNDEFFRSLTSKDSE